MKLIVNNEVVRLSLLLYLKVSSQITVIFNCEMVMLFEDEFVNFIEK